MLRDEYNDLLHDIYYEESLDSFSQNNNLTKLIDKLLADQQIQTTDIASATDLFQINKLNNNNVKKVNSVSNYFVQNE